MFVDGVEHEVVVDDQFPFDPYKEQWAFSRTNEAELWVLILEKAWAKIYGSYHRIEVGNTGEAMPVLTGCPSQSFDHRKFYWDVQKLWDKIIQADIKQHTMTCAAVSEDQKSAEEMKKLGIVDAHAYSLIAAVQIKLGFRMYEKLVLVRNPWGFKEWSGAWSDTSNKWKQFPQAEDLIADELKARDGSINKIDYLKRDVNDG